MATVEGGRTLSWREEELLGLLSGFADGDGGSDRELSFSDLVEAAPAPAAARDDHGSTVSPGGKPKQLDAAAESKQQQQKAVVPERRQRSRSRGSCGGGGDGVLLNFYVPGLRLTRSKTAQRPGRGATPPAVAQGAPTKAQAPLAAGKARLVANN
jgi:hypothetical protein